MNHAEQAEAILQRWEGAATKEGSTSIAIAHALLAINETLQLATIGVADLPISQVAEGFIAAHQAETNLADLNQRISAALELADWWESNRDAGSMSYLYAAGKLREVLR